MKRCLEVLLAMVLVIPMVIVGPVACAQEETATIAVSAAVLPHIYLVVNESGQITQIFSNSQSESEPLSIAGNINGRIINMTAQTSAQYLSLKPSLDFSKYGVLYQKPSFMQRVFKKALVQSKIF